MFKSKQKKIESLIMQYCQKVLLCMDVMIKALQRHCEDSDRRKIEKRYKEVHEVESAADDIRDEVEVMMYSKTLFPESRGDIMILLELMDRVPNQAESIVQMIRDQYVDIPEFLAPGLLDLAETCRRSAIAMVDAARKLFSNYTGATVAVGKIDEMESEADRMESELIQKIFTSDVSDLQKILLRDLVRKTAEISDRAENVGDRIRVIVAKRSI